MDIKNSLGQKRILNSIKAEEGACRFMQALDSGALRMEVLHNSAEPFPGKAEEENFISYCKFLSSANGKLIFEILEEADKDGI